WIDATDRFSEAHSDVCQVEHGAGCGADAGHARRDLARVENEGVELCVPAKIAAGGGLIVETVNGDNVRAFHEIGVGVGQGEAGVGNAAVAPHFGDRREGGAGVRKFAGGHVVAEDFS